MKALPEGATLGAAFEPTVWVGKGRMSGEWCNDERCRGFHPDHRHMLVAVRGHDGAIYTRGTGFSHDRALYKIALGQWKAVDSPLGPDVLIVFFDGDEEP